MSEGIDKLFAGGAMNSPIGRIIGMAEGNRTADGGVTANYAGHTDPGNGAWNVGNYSVNSAYYSASSPEDADRQYHGILQAEAERVAPLMQAAGLDSSNGLLMASYLDIWNQSPEMAEEGFLATLPYLAKEGITPDTLLQARIYAGDAGVGVDGFNPTGVAHRKLWAGMAKHTEDQGRRMGEIVDAMKAIGIPINGSLTGLPPAAISGDKGFTPISSKGTSSSGAATLGTNGGSVIIGTYTKDCSKTPPWDWTLQAGKIYRGCALRITTLGVEGGVSTTPMVGGMSTTTSKAKLTNASLTSTVTPPKAGTLLFPIQKAADGGSIVVTDSHGYSSYRGRNHDGIDIGSGGGSQVLAAADGVVLEAGPKGTYGNLIIIQHPNGQVTGIDSTRYAHLDNINVRAGDTVKAGQPIGTEGNTGGGLSTGNHLHFEVRDSNGQPQNPINYFDPSTTKVAEDPKGILQGGR